MIDPVKHQTPKRLRVLFLLMGIVFLALGVVQIGQWFAAADSDAIRVPYLLFGIPALVVGIAALWVFFWSRKPRA